MPLLLLAFFFNVPFRKSPWSLMAGEQLDSSLVVAAPYRQTTKYSFLLLLYSFLLLLVRHLLLVARHLFLVAIFFCSPFPGYLEAKSL